MDPPHGRRRRTIHDRQEGTLVNSISSAASSVAGSIRAQAMTVHLDSDRSIAGRLAGHFDSTRTAAALQSFSDFDAAAAATEGSRLVPPSLTSVVDDGGKAAGDAGRGAAAAGPPLSAWITPALMCAASYAFYNIFIKIGSASIHPILGGVILQFVAALLGAALLATIMVKDPAAKLEYDRGGLFWSCAAGLAVGVAEMLSFCVNGLGVPATQSIPVIIGGSVMFGAVLGVATLGERLMLPGWSGVALICVGITLDATDPGNRVEEGVDVSTGGAGAGAGAASGGSGLPPVAVWIGPALACAAAYAFYNIFIKKGSASVNPMLGGVILQFVAALFGTLLLGAIMVMDGGDASSGLPCSPAGVFWACAAGLAVGAAEMLSFCVSGMGVNSTQSIPVIIGGSVLFGAVLGLAVLGETVMARGWIGVALLTAGIGFVAADPGEKAEGH